MVIVSGIKTGFAPAPTACIYEVILLCWFKKIRTIVKVSSAIMLVG